MGASGVVYSVIGRYMDGQRVTGYHLMGSDGSQLQVNKDRAIFMISNGVIDNMRIQTDTSTDKSGIIIRGKGINLNKLPVYDENKGKFRGSQEQAVNKGEASRDNRVTTVGQFRIVNRIMQGTQCIGYTVVDGTGKEHRYSRKVILDLGLKKLLSNAEVQKIQSEKGTSLILRGSGCNLNNLPILVRMESGKIVDPNKSTSGNTLRVMRVTRSGMVCNSKDGSRRTFQPGDFISCGVMGRLEIESKHDMEEKYMVDKSDTRAICDDYLDGIEDYTVEFFGQKPIPLTKNLVLKWAIVRVK